MLSKQVLKILLAAVFVLGAEVGAHAANVLQTEINVPQQEVRAQMNEATKDDQEEMQQDKYTALPRKDATSILQEENKEYLAYQVAESAKQQVVAWAKWIIGVVAFVIAILGVKTYFDIQKKLDATIDRELETARNETKKAIDQFTQEKDLALKNFEIEVERASKLISQKASLASEQIDKIVTGLPSYIVAPPISGLRRLIYDAGNKAVLPGKLVRSEGSPPATDKVVNTVYDNIGIAYTFFNDVFDYRVTLDDDKIICTVHYLSNYNNAFWDGQQLVFGDGDGRIFTKFTGLDLIAGELSYHLIQQKTKLTYQGEQGALITHYRDVFSAMAVQWHRRQTAADASWLIGADMLAADIKGTALRSMKAPGTAYDDSLLGKDPQPANIKEYVKTDADNGGVHINSGIPNHAFYLAAVKVGGFSWEKIGRIWFKSLDYLTPTTDFKGFAAITLETARNLYGENSDEAKAVADGWAKVGINPQVG